MDPIAEMFSQIRNAQGAHHETLVITYSKIKWAILEILKSHQQITGFRLLEQKSASDKSKVEEIQKQPRKIEISLNQNLINIKRVSRPGRRVYTTCSNIPRPKRPRSIVVISTSQGLLEGKEAREKGLGGELIAEIN